MCVLFSESVRVLLQWSSLYSKYLQESCFEQKTEFYSPGKKESRAGRAETGQQRSARHVPGFFCLSPSVLAWQLGSDVVLPKTQAVKSLEVPWVGWSGLPPATPVRHSLSKAEETPEGRVGFQAMSVPCLCPLPSLWSAQRWCRSYPGETPVR